MYIYQAHSAMHLTLSLSDIQSNIIQFNVMRGMLFSKVRVLISGLMSGARLIMISSDQRSVRTLYL